MGEEVDWTPLEALRASEWNKMEQGLSEEQSVGILLNFEYITPLEPEVAEASEVRLVAATTYPE